MLIGILGGAEVEKVNLMALIAKRIQMTGTLLTPRSDEYKVALTAEFAAKTLELFGTNKIKPVVDCVFSFDQIRQAHEYMEQNKNTGKIILKVD